MANGARRIQGSDLYDVTQDARVVSIRWDLVQWALVLDLDAPTSEAKDAPVMRAWLVFSGLSELSWPMKCVRIPNGCGLTSTIRPSPGSGEFQEYRFTALLPRFRADESLEGNPAQEVMIRAQALHGVASERSARPGEFGLSWAARVALASDEEMLGALGEDAG